MSRILRGFLYRGTAALFVVAIRFIGSLGLWVGTPLLWLRLGSHLESVTGSLGVMFAGVFATIAVLAVILVQLSGIYRRNRPARGVEDTGYSVLERVLVISAGVALAGFVLVLFPCGCEPGADQDPNLSGSSAAGPLGPAPTVFGSHWE